VWGTTARGLRHNRPVPVRALDHVQLAMPPGEEARATAFYETLLGIARVAKPDHLAGRGGCWFESGAVKIHLGVDADFRPARKAHPALIVDGLDRLVETLSGAGVAVEAAEELEGRRHVYLDDPFGNRVELIEPASG
jgi:catechol 2,3-dioxygenase-like lactoylglutathione lyase family enzyme